MSAWRLPGISGLAASNSATASSTPRSRRGQCNAPRSDTGIKKVSTDSERSRPAGLSDVDAASPDAARREDSLVAPHHSRLAYLRYENRFQIPCNRSLFRGSANFGFRDEFAVDSPAALVRGAWSANKHVPAILAGAKPPVNSDDGYLTMGGPYEAPYYVTECGPAWHRTPGAVAWLTKLVATLAPKRRTRATMH